MKKIFIDRNEPVASVVEKILSETEKDIVLVVPRNAKLGESVGNFHLLKRESGRRKSRPRSRPGNRPRNSRSKDPKRKRKPRRKPCRNRSRRTIRMKSRNSKKPPRLIPAGSPKNGWSWAGRWCSWERPGGCSARFSPAQK